jgi:hypothetical protein
VNPQGTKTDPDHQHVFQKELYYFWHELGYEPRDPGLTWRSTQGVGWREAGPVPPRPLPARFPLWEEEGMRFLVLGAGSLGSYFGGMLLQGGADILRRCAERFGAGRTNPAACKLSRVTV